MDQRSLKSKTVCSFFIRCYLDPGRFHYPDGKYGACLSVPRLTLKGQPGLQSPGDGVGRGMGRGELTDASPLAGIPRSPGSTCSTLHTLFPQPFIQNRAFDCKPFSPAFEFLSAPCGCYQFTNKEKLKLVYELLLLYPSSAIS